MDFSSLRRYLPPFLALLALWVGVKFLLPLLLPFLLSALLALAAEPLVRLFQNRLHLPRPAASGISVLLCLGAAAAGIAGLTTLLLRELGQAAQALPDLESGMDSLQQQLLTLANRTPDSVNRMLSRTVQDLFSDGTALLDGLSGKMLEWASGAVSHLPDSALGICTGVVAAFMISGELPKIQSRIRQYLPPRLLPEIARLKGSLKAWLLAQCKLMGLTMLVLLAGFCVLGIPYAPVWAALIAFADALPVLGTGTVLVPWSIIWLMQGRTVQAVGLLCIYVLTATLRSVLEPRLIGKQLGLDPLVTLMALYAGYKLWGIIGMILSPLLAATLTQLTPQTAEKEQE